MASLTRRFARRFRQTDALNAPVAIVIRALARRFTRLSRFTAHWPRIGWFEVTLPNDARLRIRGRLGDAVSHSLFQRGWDGSEPETCRVVQHFAADIREFVDVGAHVGLYSLLVKSFNSDVRVVSLEPHPVVRRQLAEHMHSNRLDIELLDVAAADEPGEAVLFASKWNDVPSSSGLGSWINSSDMIEIRVACRPLDRIVEERRLAPDLIKIDTEGTEVDVLRGALETLTKHRPTLIIEILAEMGGVPMATAPAIHSILGPLGYRYFHLSGDSVVEASQPQPWSTGRNWLMVARPDHLEIVANLQRPPG